MIFFIGQIFSRFLDVLKWRAPRASKWSGQRNCPITDNDAKRTPLSFRLDSAGYIRRCLAAIVPKLAGRTFQQDGAKAHTSARTVSYLRRKQVDFIEDWPPYSPDLNCIELVWPLLNQRVAQLHPVNLDELKTAIVAAWRSISQNEIDNICGEFRPRVRRSLAAAGSCLWIKCRYYFFFCPVHLKTSIVQKKIFFLQNGGNPSQIFVIGQFWLGRVLGVKKRVFFFSFQVPRPKIQSSKKWFLFIFEFI